MWACTYGIDHWMPVKLVGCLTAKLVDCLSTKLLDLLTARLVKRLTAVLVNHLTAKLVVVNLVQLHLTKSTSVCKTAPKSLFWALTFVPGFVYVPWLANY